MKKSPLLTRWSLYLLLVAMVGSLFGAAYVYQTGRPLAAQHFDSKGPSQQGLGVWCHGRVDLESGVLQLVPQQPGSVTEVIAFEGQSVKKGDVLLKVQDQPFVHKVAEAQAAVNIAEKQLVEARQSLDQFEEVVRAQQAVVLGHREKLAAAESKLAEGERLLGILNNPKTGKIDIEAGRREVNALRAVVTAEEANLERIKKGRPDPKIDQSIKNVEMKKALLDQAREAFDRCSLKAPQDGLILQIQATVGTQFSAQPNHPAVIMAPNQSRIVRVEVDQEFASRITLGAVAQIQDEFNNSGPTYVGKVLRIGEAFLRKRPEFGPEIITSNGDNRVLEVIVSLEDANPMPKLGQRMRVNIGASSR